MWWNSSSGGAARDKPVSTAASSSPAEHPGLPAPPTKHQMALMIWIAAFPTLTAINLLCGDWLAALHPILRTFVVVTTAVPIVIYGIMPQLHRLRGWILRSKINNHP
jgi:antibiotic biosynthesis monooxygenase (ABM) superfamily enzyme